MNEGEEKEWQVALNASLSMTDGISGGIKFGARRKKGAQPNTNTPRIPVDLALEELEKMRQLMAEVVSVFMNLADATVFDEEVMKKLTEEETEHVLEFCRRLELLTNEKLPEIFGTRRKK